MARTHLSAKRQRKLDQRFEVARREKAEKRRRREAERGAVVEEPRPAPQFGRQELGKAP